MDQEWMDQEWMGPRVDGGSQRQMLFERKSFQEVREVFNFKSAFTRKLN